MRTTHPSRVRTGLVLLGLLSVFDVVFTTSPAGTETSAGPPIEVLIAGGILGLVSLVLVVLVWRGARGTVGWALVVLRVLSALLGVPAFLAPDVPTWARVMVGVFALLTIAGVVLVRPALHRGAAVPAGLGVRQD